MNVGDIATVILPTGHKTLGKITKVYSSTYKISLLRNIGIRRLSKGSTWNLPKSLCSPASASEVSAVSSPTVTASDATEANLVASALQKLTAAEMGALIRYFRSERSSCFKDD